MTEITHSVSIHVKKSLYKVEYAFMIKIPEESQNKWNMTQSSKAHTVNLALTYYMGGNWKCLL